MCRIVSCRKSRLITRDVQA